MRHKSKKAWGGDVAKFRDGWRGACSQIENRWWHGSWGRGTCWHWWWVALRRASPRRLGGDVTNKAECVSWESCRAVVSGTGLNAGRGMEVGGGVHVM